jgi:histidyl-tRNA synthetase
MVEIIVAIRMVAKNSDKNYGAHGNEGNEGIESSGLGLRFDLTVPLARYVSSNYGSLNFPYKRYQIAPVWRGERPQAGRYRQFYQCDVDIIAEGELPLEYDAEVLSIVFQIFKKYWS